MFPSLQLIVSSKMHVVYKQFENIKYPTLYNFAIGTELDCRKQNIKYRP
jgi:hypothetical protein